jgi:monomeric isocitrate dehydrogenase
MIEPKAVQQCKDIVRATTWEGDIRVNITTIIGAGRILAKRVDELEEALRTIKAHQEMAAGGLVRLSTVYHIATTALKDEARKTQP